MKKLSYLIISFLFCISAFNKPVIAQWTIAGNDIFNSNQGGNVGIGTSNPLYRFHVAGDGFFSGRLRISTIDNVGDNSSVLTIGNSGSVSQINTSSWDKNSSDDISSIYGSGPIDVGVTGNVRSINFNPSGLSNSTWGGGSDFKWSFNVGGTINPEIGFKNKTVYINNGSSLGIGTTAPGSKLSVGGPGNSNWAIYGSGFAGIWGDGSSYGTGVYGRTGNGTGIGVQGENGGTGIGVYGINSSSGIGGFFTSTSGYALITGSGNVGIGVTKPSQKMEVAGGIKINSGTRPTCNTATRGTMWFTQGVGSSGPSAKDSFVVCAQDANGISNWRTLY